MSGGTTLRSYPASLDAAAAPSSAGCSVADECAAMHASGSTTDPSLLTAYACALLHRQDWTAARHLAELHEPALDGWSRVASLALRNQPQMVLQQLHSLAATPSSSGLDPALAALIPTYCAEIANAYRRSLLKNWRLAGREPPDYYRTVLGTVDVAPPSGSSAPRAFSALPDAAAFFEAPAL
jgi:hypothetical protein